MHARKSNVKFYDLRDRRVVPHPQKPSMGSGRVSARIMADQTGPKFFLQRRRQQRR
jgi:hypothetical protein